MPTISVAIGVLRLASVESQAEDRRSGVGAVTVLTAKYRVLVTCLPKSGDMLAGMESTTTTFLPSHGGKWTATAETPRYAEI